jgi:pimeloyl-ACP methyl ester carboxylesterase
MSPGAGQTALVNGCSIYYEVHGSGEPLVLLHGFQASGAVWGPVIDAFKTGYRLIVPDLRGHGRSNNPANVFTHRQSALDIYALLDRLGIERFKAMGISSGGMILLHMAAGRPERVEAMVLIGATFKYHVQARVIQRKLTVESMSEEDWRKAREFHKLGDDQIRSLRAQFHAFKDVDDDVNFTPESLARITARTFVVHGDRDPFFPVSIPVEMYTSLPRAWLWIIPNGGHIPVVEHRAEFNRVAAAFLRGDWEKTRPVKEDTP